jgi:hypothetical protein
MDKHTPHTNNPDDNCDENASRNDSVRYKQDHQDHSVVYDYHGNGHLLYLVDSHRVYDIHYADYGNFLHW